MKFDVEYRLNQVLAISLFFLALLVVALEVTMIYGGYISRLMGSMVVIAFAIPSMMLGLNFLGKARAIKEDLDVVKRILNIHSSNTVVFVQERGRKRLETIFRELVKYQQFNIKTNPSTLDAVYIAVMEAVTEKRYELENNIRALQDSLVDLGLIHKTEYGEIEAEVQKRLEVEANG